MLLSTVLLQAFIGSVHAQNPCQCQDNLSNAFSTNTTEPETSQEYKFIYFPPSQPPPVYQQPQGVPPVGPPVGDNFPGYRYPEYVPYNQGPPVCPYGRTDAPPPPPSQEQYPPRMPCPLQGIDVSRMFQPNPPPQPIPYQEPSLISYVEAPRFRYQEAPQVQFQPPPPLYRPQTPEYATYPRCTFEHVQENRPYSYPAACEAPYYGEERGKCCCGKSLVKGAKDLVKNLCPCKCGESSDRIYKGEDGFCYMRDRHGFYRVPCPLMNGQGSPEFIPPTVVEPEPVQPEAVEPEPFFPEPAEPIEPLAPIIPEISPLEPLAPEIPIPQFEPVIPEAPPMEPGLPPYEEPMPMQPIQQPIQPPTLPGWPTIPRYQDMYAPAYIPLPLAAPAYVPAGIAPINPVVPQPAAAAVPEEPEIVEPKPVLENCNNCGCKCGCCNCNCICDNCSNDGICKCPSCCPFNKCKCFNGCCRDHSGEGQEKECCLPRLRNLFCCRKQNKPIPIATIYAPERQAC